jgi:hypothetical protein
MDEKNKLALIEGGKKAACVATNAALFFFLPGWVFGDESWFPADPVWVHITITMLCELDSMDRLNEKILLRTAGTTIGALSGCVMSFSGLGDIQRLLIIVIWITTLGFIEKKDPSRSYTWTIATVTFGICTFLGRMGKLMTPWKRWFSIVLGTIVTAFYLLLLPYLGVLPRVIVRDELGATARKAWLGCVVMLEDALENPGDDQAGQRISEQQVAVHGLLTKWPACWKQYKYARNWLNLQPKKPLPMDSLQALLKESLFNLFLSSSAAARAVHRTGRGPAKNDSAAFRIELHKLGAAIEAVISAVATKGASMEVRIMSLKDLETILGAVEKAAEHLAGMSQVHQAALAACLQDTVKVTLRIQDAMADVQGNIREYENDKYRRMTSAAEALSYFARPRMAWQKFTARANKLLQHLGQVEVSASLLQGAPSVKGHDACDSFQPNKRVKVDEAPSSPA